MARFFIKLRYAGGAYQGWQLQKKGETIQQLVNSALSTILQQAIRCTGSSRTDTGVHALENYAHLDVKGRIPKDFLHRVNGLLPRDIHLAELIPVKASAHARFDANSREYQYELYFEKDPFREGFAYRYPFGKLELSKMKRAAAYLKKYDDYSSFCKAKTQVKTKICHIEQASWTARDNGFVFQIRSNRFLRGMVRGLVGTMIHVGTGKLSAVNFRDIIESKDISRTDFSAPPEGLYLTKVNYPYPLKPRSFERA